MKLTELFENMQMMQRFFCYNFRFDRVHMDFAIQLPWNIDVFNFHIVNSLNSKFIAFNCLNE